jgi:cytochrome c
MEWMTRSCVVFLLLSVLLWAGCTRTPSDEQNPIPAMAQQTPEEFMEGETLFATHCARCHGEKAAGTTLGPSLVHKIYEPSHHADPSFHLAVLRGVRAHHWSFGNMPSMPGVKSEEVSAIVSYVRWLQRQAGIE